MPNDIFYGSESELRLGIMADADTDPTAWHTLEFMSASFAVQRERRPRPKAGSTRHNPLDPIKPRAGFLRISADIVLDADTRQLARWLRDLVGAPATSGPAGSIYTHVWSSGATDVALAAIQVRTADDEIRVYRGLTLGAISLQATGEQTQDYDIQLSLRGMSRARVADWLTGTAAAVPTEAPVLRTVFRVDGTAADNTLDASWSWDRGITEDLFLSTTPEVSGLRPGPSALSGRAQFRAVGAAFDDLEEDDTVFAADLQMLGVETGHEIKLEHPQAQLNAPALTIPGAGLVERTVDWFGFQDAADPGARITIKNDVTSYAT